MSAKKPPAVSHDDINKRVAEFTKSLGAQVDGIVTSCCPGGSAPIMIVGHRHLEGEKSPFDDPKRAGLIATLQRLNIKPHMVFLTDLIKYPVADNRLTPNVYSRYREFLFDQIALVQPKAVVLLGLEVAQNLFPLTLPTIDHARLRRFVWPQRTRTNFFVTYAPEESEGLLGAMLGTKQYAMFADLKAVAEADEIHFDRIVPVAGFSRE